MKKLICFTILVTIVITMNVNAQVSTKAGVILAKKSCHGIGFRCFISSNDTDNNAIMEKVGNGQIRFTILSEKLSISDKKEMRIKNYKLEEDVLLPDEVGKTINLPQGTILKKGIYRITQKSGNYIVLIDIK
jgi:hypothetical protein